MSGPGGAVPSASGAQSTGLEPPPDRSLLEPKSPLVNL